MAMFLITETNRYEIEADTIEEARALWREYEFDSDCVDSHCVEFLDGTTTFEEDN